MQLADLENTKGTQVNTTSRWHMNRAGILNFWHYDDEEFYFEEGRIILRGTNGSGKSVTMQSFLPLVLDGDTRPKRLDPFGSRDRRLEYYLLGETEEGHTDRTGYLWLEFYHTEKQLYKTIGIGLRARRGVASIGFWGFLLDDGRRINRDLWLYDHDLWLEHKIKIPINRKRLEEIFSDGGQVVQEKDTYRDMVNKALFGFEDIDSYQDLLKLLLELRSPKLSKDFKPTSMYKILTKALPPLHEKDLSPLTSVLEDMDQITDRLDELQDHHTSLEKLNRNYERYCNFLLQMYSKRLLETLNEKVLLTKDMDSLSLKKGKAEVDENDIVVNLEINIQKLKQVDEEYEILNRSEAMEKQRELEHSNEFLVNTKTQLDIVNARINNNTKRVNKIENEIIHLDEIAQELSTIQNDYIRELENYARMIEFREHDVYQNFYQQEAKGEEKWIINWKNDLHNHKNKLLVAQNVARQLNEATKAVAEAEIQLGDAHQDRVLLEEQYSVEEDILRKLKQHMKEDLQIWHKQLTQLVIEDDQLRECLRSITSIATSMRHYDLVRQPIIEIFEKQNNELIRSYAELQQKQKQLQEEYTKVDQEIQEWQDFKEPEPARTTNRLSSRKQRQTEMGAPLYSACEFESWLNENEQAQLEETLIQAGLLDAWIVPGGKISLWNPDNEEEIWFEPNPVKGSTLANVLKGVPPLNSGLSMQDIQTVLKSVLWSQETFAKDNHGVMNQVYINSNGIFRLGPLLGKNVSKTRAQYIGIETRLRTKQIEIERLQIILEQIREQIEIINNDISINYKQQRKLIEEKNSFPSDTELQNQIDKLLNCTSRIVESMKQEQKVEVWYKQKATNKNEIQLRLLELTEDWSSLKQEKSISEAIEICGSYGNLISELSSSLNRVRDVRHSYETQKNQKLEVVDQLNSDYEEKNKYEDRYQKYTTRTNQLQLLIKDMDIETVYVQLQKAKRLKIEIPQTLEGLREKKVQVSKIITAYNKDLEYKDEKLQNCSMKMQKTMSFWHREIENSPIAEFREYASIIDDEKIIYKLCQQIITEFGTSFDSVNKDMMTQKLITIHSEVNASLIEYVINIESIDPERMIVVSKQDLSHAIPLIQLLQEVKELIEEQQTLLTEKDRELYEKIILQSVGRAIRLRIHRARDWVAQMNNLMKQRDTSSGLQLSLQWRAISSETVDELETATLVDLLLRDSHRLDDAEIEQVVVHFRNRILSARQSAEEEQGAFRDYMYALLDYRTWFEFILCYRKNEKAPYKELKDSKFNVLSGGEKAMSMYIPLLAAMYSRYSDANSDAPKIISLDEAFAGVDEINIRDMFLLLTDMDFDYMMTSQVLWGCYDSVPNLAIYDIHRPKDSNVVTLFHYRWNGKKLTLVDTKV